MGVKIESQAEPIPGYTLIERLGGGGFGEVWKALAPGGLYKAIKFVYGDLQAGPDDGDGSRAEQELKALSRVKSVHHPYILSLERFDIIQGQLIIVMELADRTLWDRFRECRTQGLPGIPREELLGYVQETAEALDLMNNQYQLQHLDIKPQNLFLVYQHVKVADFGLVKDLEGMAATVTGGVTPVYASPETFDGWISRFSDQYSLAIVYQELLTGQRPFTGSTMRQLVLQHLQGAPDLSSLPVADRPAIARALSKNPDDRFPCCLDFVKAVREANQVASFPAAAVAAPEEETGSQAESAPDLEDSQPVDVEVTQSSRGRNPRPKSPKKDAAVLAPEEKPAPPAMPPRPDVKGDEEPTSTFKPFRPNSRPGKKAEDSPNGAAKAAAASSPAHNLPVSADGLLQPALIIGLGQVGLVTLRQLRKQLNEQFGHPDTVPHLRLLYLDTDPEAVHEAKQGNHETALLGNETFLTRLHRPSHYLKTKEGRFDSWLDSKLLYRIPRQQNHAGVRALGRLAFVDNYPAIAKRLEIEVQTCCATETLQTALQQTKLGLRCHSPRVYVVTSLAGGTGGGMFLDVAFVVRGLLKKLGQEQAEVVGVCLLPPADRDPRNQPALASAFAALTELGHFSAAGANFSARYPTGDRQEVKVVSEPAPPFQRCLLFPFADNAAEVKKLFEPGNTELPAALVRVSQFLFGDLVSPLGADAEKKRRDWQREHGVLRNRQQEPHFNAVGTYRILWPRRQLVQQAAGRVCRRLVQRWMSKDANAVSEEIKQWAQQQWDATGLRAEDLIGKHRERCEALLKQAPETMFGNALGPLTQHLAAAPGRSPQEVPNLTPVVQGMDYFEKLLGIPEECRSQNSSIVHEWVEPGVVEKALKEVAVVIANDCEQKMAELVVRLIEEPRYRLAGAEEAIRQFSTNVEQTLQAHESLAKELHERSALLYQKIQGLLEAPVVAPTPTASIWRRKQQPAANAAAELLELLRSYPKCRYQSLVLQHVTSLYVSLRGLLSDEIREVGFCRQRLTELADLVENKQPSPAVGGAGAAQKDDPAADLCLLPQGCASFDDVVRLLDARISAKDLVEFDQKIQNLIRRQFRALVQVCMSPSNVVRGLAPLMRREAEQFLETQIGSASVVNMYRNQKATADDGQDPEELLVNHLVEAYDEAAPELAKGNTDKEICLVCIPAGPEGEGFADLVRRALPQAHLVFTDRTDEIVIYREDLEMPLSDVELLGPLGQEFYRQRAASDPSLLHSRGDITEWRAPVPVS
jgi:serine/threonine protein kinase